MRVRRWATPVVALLTALAAVGCSGDHDGPTDADATKTAKNAPTSSVAAPVPVPAPSSTLPPVPRTVQGYEDICDQDQAGYRSPKVYAGPGPHPVVLVPRDSFYVRDLPQGWAAEDPSTAALIVCKTTKAMTTKLGDCTYKDSVREGATRTLPLYGTTHTLTVRELHTASVVTTIDLDMDAYDCPPLATATQQSVTVSGVLPTSWVTDALRPFVTATAPAPART